MIHKNEDKGVRRMNNKSKEPCEAVAAVVLMMGSKSDERYRCPDCNSPLFYHHENEETVTFECKKCKHFVLARKC